MKDIFIIIVFFLIAGPGFTQTLTITDKTTTEPLSDVAIFSTNPTISTITNKKGQADISGFKNTTAITLRHIGYGEMVYTYAQLSAMKFHLEMTTSNISLNEVVVSVNRWEEEQMEIPYRVERISIKDVNFQNPQTSADLLSSGGYAYIQKSQMAGGSPMLRGFATNRVMLVVDGIRMNNAIFRTGNLQNVISIDANALESTEVLFGPGAVMYGSDAIGGVMDFHTLTPSLSNGDKLFLNANAFTRYSTANKERTGHVDFNIGLKKWAFVTSFSHSAYDDLRAGTNGEDDFLRPYYQETINGIDSIIKNDDPELQVKSGYNQTNLMQKIRFKPSENWDFEYGIHYSATSDAPRYDRLYLDSNDDGVFDNAEWYYGPQKWMMNRLGITNTATSGIYDRFRLVAAHQAYEESRHDRKFNNSKIRHQTETVKALSLNLDFDKKFNEKSSLYYGLETVYNLVGSEAERVNINTGDITPTNTRYPDGSTWQSYGIYGSFKHHLGTKWILNTGLRYSYYNIQVEFDTSMFAFPFTDAENKQGSLNGSLGLVYAPDKTLQVYLNGATGFRAPNIDDIGKVFESEPGSVVVPNPDLKPEYAYNAEMGFAKVLGDYLKMDVSVYYTWLDDALARRNFKFNGEDSIMYDEQLSQVQAIQNITSAYIYGIQAGLDVNFGKGIGLKSTICYQKGEEQSEDSLKYYPLRHAAPMYGSTHLTYERKKLKLDFYANYNSAMDFEDLALSERMDAAPYAKDEEGKPFVPGWMTLNFKAAYFINKNISVNLGIENITDRLYRPYASGISAPGRNFIFTLRGRI